MTENTDNIFYIDNKEYNTDNFDQSQKYGRRSFDGRHLFPGCGAHRKNHFRAEVQTEVRFTDRRRLRL